MVVSSQKFLPSGKSGSLAVRPTAKLSMIRKPLVATSSDGEAKKTIADIHKKVTSLTFIFRKSRILTKKIIRRKRKSAEIEENRKREEKLEERKNSRKKDTKNDSLLVTPPGGSIIDSLTRFAGFTLLGYVVGKYSNLLPKLVDFSKTIQPAIETFGNFAKSVVGGSITFIEKGYEAYDTVNDFVKKIGGENYGKLFEQFSGTFNRFLQISLLTGIAGFGGGLLPKAFVTPSSAGLGSAGAQQTRNLQAALESVRGREFNRRKKDIRSESMKARIDARKAIVDFAREERKRGPRAKKPSDLRADRIKELTHKIGLKNLSYTEKVERVAMVSELTKLVSEDMAETKMPTKTTAVKPAVPADGTIKFGYSMSSLEYKGPRKNTPYVRFQYGNRTKSMTLGSANYLKEMIRMGSFDMADKFFEDPKRYSSQVSAFLGAEAEMQAGRVLQDRKFTAKDVVPKTKPKPNFGQRFKGGLSGGGVIKAGIVGGVIDLIVKLVSGQDPGRAAATATAATLGGIVGGALGTAITTGAAIFSGGIGAFLAPVLVGGLSIAGATVFDMLVGGIYDAVLGKKKSYASGGQVTRGGVTRGAVSRDITPNIKNIKTKRLKTVTPQQTAVGKNANLGTFKDSNDNLISNYQKIYGEKGLQALKDSSRDVKKIKFMQNIWGALGGAYIDMLLGQRPDNSLASDIGSIIGVMTNERYGRKLGQELSNSLEDSANNIFRHLYAAVGITPDTTTTTTTTSNQYTPRNIPSSGYKPPSAGLFNAIQYITGDTTQSANYKSDHGGKNYHEHIAFKTEPDKERAKAALRAAGFEIGSELRPGDTGWHGANLAIDVPMYKPSGGGVQKGYSDDTKGEQQFSAEVRKILGLNAPVVKPTPKPAPAKPAPAKPAPKGQKVSYNGLNQQTSYELAIHERNVFLYQQETVLA